MKTEVYSWRLSTDLKSDLEREARRRKMSLAAVLDVAAREWLSNTGSETDAEEQLRLQKAASKYLGIFAGGVPTRSTNVRDQVRQRLRARYGR